MIGKAWFHIVSSIIDTFLQIIITFFQISFGLNWSISWACLVTFSSSRSAGLIFQMIALSRFKRFSLMNFRISLNVSRSRIIMRQSILITNWNLSLYKENRHYYKTIKYSFKITVSVSIIPSDCVNPNQFLDRLPKKSA